MEENFVEPSRPLSGCSRAQIAHKHKGTFPQGSRYVTKIKDRILYFSFVLFFCLFVFNLPSTNTFPFIDKNKNIWMSTRGSSTSQPHVCLLLAAFFFFFFERVVMFLALFYAAVLVTSLADTFRG